MYFFILRNNDILLSAVSKIGFHQLCLLTILVDDFQPRISGADPGFEKGRGAVASEARSEDFLGQFGGLLK